MGGPPPVKVDIVGRDKISMVLNTVSGKLRKFGGNMTSFGKSWTTRVSLPIGIAAGFMLRSAGNFQEAMTKLRQSTNASSEEFFMMREAAKKVGATTEFSATQAAGAMEFLSRAGYDTNQILGAMPAITDLAAARNIELGQSADIVSNILSTYKMKIEEAGRVTDILAFVSAHSKTSVLDMGDAFKEIGPMMEGMGIKFEEVASMIGLMSMKGYKGGEAAAILKKSIASLLAPSSQAIETLNRLGVKKASIMDSQGRVKSLTSIIEALQGAGATTGDVMQIFGKKAGPGMAALLQMNVSSIKEMQKGIQGGIGEAARLAALKENDLKEATDKLKASTESLAISIADSGILQIFVDMVKGATDMVRSFNQSNPEIMKFVVGLAGLLFISGPLITAIGGISTALAFMAANPVVLIIAALVALVALIAHVVKYWDFFSYRLKHSFVGYAFGKMGQFMGGEKYQMPKGGWTPGKDSGIEIPSVTSKGMNLGNFVSDLMKTKGGAGEPGKVQMDMNFANVPAGARVTTTASGVDLNQKLGYALQ